jgi:hypothetical protein
MVENLSFINDYIIKELQISIIAETLTTMRVIQSETNSPPADVSTK